MERIEKNLEYNEFCFGCGEDNPIGAKLNFFKISDESVKSNFLVPNTWGGWGKIIHGGLQTVLLDEVSAWVIVALLNDQGLTIKAQIEFLKPLYVEEEVEIIGSVEKIDNKDITIGSVLRNKKGETCTKGTFVYRKVAMDKIKKMAKIPL
jgi:acyl-coenzyme A thioesterase PaaI-like protein